MNYKIIHNELELREIKWYKQCYGKIVQSMYDSILDNVMVSSRNTTSNMPGKLNTNKNREKIKNETENK